jgi:protease I
MRTALVVLAQEGYQDHELEGTVQGLSGAGFDIALCSKESGACTGKFGGKVQATLAMRDVDPSAFDRFAFIGGPGAKALRDDPEALALAKKIAGTGHVFGAICIAPTILAAAGVLKGKKATVWNNDGEQGTFLSYHGAEFTDDDVTVDGLLVTANGPEAAAEFGKKLASI